MAQSGHFFYICTKLNQMIVKQVLLDEKGRNKLKSGISIIEAAVSSTLGPCGQTVLVESENHIGGVTVTKDGVTVARSINLYDPVENLAVQLVREAASKTATMAGDGTTTSIVLTKAIIDSFESMAQGANKTEVLRNIQSFAEKVCKILDKKSKKVNGKVLLDVATISANNDPVIGKLIADVYSHVSHVVVENSKTTKTYSEIISGIRVQRGWTSKYFVNDHKKNECVLEDAYVLVTDGEISNLANIESILAPIVRDNKPLLIIGNLSPQVLATLSMNVVKNKIRCCNIIPPNFGYRKDDMMRDIAVALGAHYYSESTGDNLALCSIDGLGKAKRIIVGQDNTVIVPMEESPQLNDYILQLRESIEQETTEADVQFLNERIANIFGGIGVIYVGAQSDIEQKELRDRIDDAVLAVKAAKEEGVLPGAGLALIRGMHSLDGFSKVFNVDEYEAEKILLNAVYAPFRKICSNAGLAWEDVLADLAEGNFWYGFDVKNGKYGDMMRMGVIDPCKVTKSALMNAVSVAVTILSTNAIITNVRENDSTK